MDWKPLSLRAPRDLQRVPVIRMVVSVLPSIDLAFTLFLTHSFSLLILRPHVGPQSDVTKKREQDRA